MRIESEITKEDYRQFLIYYFFKKQLRRRLIIILLAALLIPGFLNMGKEWEIQTVALQVLGSGLIFGGFYMGMMWLSIWLGTRFQKGNAGETGKKTFVLKSDGLERHGSDGDFVLSPANILEVEESDRAVYVFHHRMAAWIIPKRDMKSASDLTGLLKGLQKLKEKH